MSDYIIIETDDGFSVAELPEGKTAVAAAKEHGAVLIDEGPYHSFHAANEVLATMPNPYEAAKEDEV